MRHKIAGRKLDRPTAHRMAMLRGMVCDLIIGFFLILIALGYNRPNMAKGTLTGFCVAFLISIHPLWLTFFA